MSGDDPEIPEELTRLSCLEIYVLIQRGQLTGLAFTRQEVASLLGCTAERVRQMERHALKQLAELPAIQQLRDLLTEPAA